MTKANGKPRPPTARWDRDYVLAKKIRELMGQLQRRAAQCIPSAESFLHSIQKQTFWAFTKDLERRARVYNAGYERCEHPIETLLKTADFVNPLLLWLADNDAENIKKYASLRWTWPAYISLMSAAEEPYQKLMPTYAKSGKIKTESPIHFGKNVGLNISRAKTKVDLLFTIAVFVKRHFEHKFMPSRTELSYGQRLKKEYSTIPKKLKGLPRHPKWYGLQRGGRVLSYERVLGELNRNNWLKWKPFIDDFLTNQLGPPEARWRIFRKRDDHWVFTQDEDLLKLWCEYHLELGGITSVQATQILFEAKKLKWKSRELLLQDSDIPEVISIVGTGKIPERKWHALKKALMKRIYTLLPKS